MARSLTLNQIQAVLTTFVASSCAEQRLETMKLLENIKAIKADIRSRQLRPAASGTQTSGASPDIVVVQKVQQMQREINEARSKKELVKGILRVSIPWHTRS